MKLKKLLGAAVSAGFCAVCAAHPARVLFEGMRHLRNDRDKLLEEIDTIKVTVPLHGKRVVLKFDKQKHVQVDTKSSFLQGTISINDRRQKHPAAASIIDGKIHISYPGTATGSRHSRQRIYTVTAPVIEGNGEVLGTIKSVPSGVMQKDPCPVESSPKAKAESSTVQAINEGLPPNLSYVATLHTFADQEFYEIYGNSTNDKIIEYVNIAESFYLRQFNIAFRIVDQTIFTEKTPETSSGLILATFRDKTDPQKDSADLKHLFTGKDMDGTTIGLAFISTVCAEPEYAYGITQDFSGGAFTPYTFAHELGHNFGGMHDKINRSIMFPYIQAYPEVRFSQQSVDEISSHLLHYGSCLSVESTTPKVPGSTLTIAHRGRHIYGTLLSVTGRPLANQPVLLSVNFGASRRVRTDSAGNYRYTLKKTRKRRFYMVYATTEKGESVSGTLMFDAK